MSQPAADGIAQGLVAEGLFIIELLDEIESVLADEPVAVAAMPPLGEVDLVEWAPSKLAASTAWTPGTELSHLRMEWACSPSLSWRLSCSRMSWGRRAILPVRMI